MISGFQGSVSIGQRLIFSENSSVAECGHFALVLDFRLSWIFFFICTNDSFSYIISLSVSSDMDLIDIAVSVIGPHLVSIHLPEMVSSPNTPAEFCFIWAAPNCKWLRGYVTQSCVYCPFPIHNHSSTECYFESQPVRCVTCSHF